MSSGNFSISAAAVSTASTASVTLFQALDGAYVSTVAPTPTAPASGCAIVSQQLTTITEAYPQTTDYNTIPPGLYCTCAGGVMAGTSVSADTLGTQYIYCATGGQSTDPAQATATPSGSPGNANNTDWVDVSCSYGSLPNALSDPTEQWNDAGASAAWLAGVQNWYANAGNSESNASFANALSNFFHGPRSFFCGELGQSTSCAAPGLQCGQYSAPNAPVDSPAGYVILNSLAAINQPLDTFYNDVGRAAEIVTAQIGQFTDQFSVIQQDIQVTMEMQEQEKKDFEIALVLLDILSTLLLTVALKETPKFQSGTFSNGASAANTIIYGVVSDAWTYTELTLETGNILYTQNTFTYFASQITQKWQADTQNVAYSIFGSPDAVSSYNPQQLGALINEGTFFTDEPASQSTVNVTQAMTRAFFSQVLVAAWNGGPSIGQPFILSSQGWTNDDNASGAVSGQNVTTCDGVSLPYFIGDIFLVPDGGTAGSGVNALDALCFVADGNAYWLFEIKSSSSADGAQGAVDTPYNWDQLNGTADAFGGLDITEVQQNAVNSWISNGYQNDWSNAIAPTDFQDIASLSSSDLSSALGLVQIPVCSAADLMKTWTADPFNNAGSAAWPCPVDGTATTNPWESP